MSSENNFRCQPCGQETEQIDVTVAAQITKVTKRTIYLWARQGRLHVNRTDSGQLKICQASLALVTKYAAPQVNHGSIDGRIRLVIRLAEQQYERDNLTLSKMASHAGLSIWYLARLFKKNTGISFGEYLRNLRIKKAEILLRDTLLSIKEIAAAVGYKHVSDFDHHFKSTHNMRPGEYRRSQQTRE